MSHGSPVDLELQVRGHGSAKSQPRQDEGRPRLHVPSTRPVHGRVQLEGLLEVVETEHLLVERIHLNAAQVAGEAEGLGGLWAQGTVRAPRPPGQTRVKASACSRTGSRTC